MTVILARGVKDAIARAARVARPFEACGLLLGQRRGEDRMVAEATLARNLAAEPRHRFEVDPAHLLAAQRAARAGGPAILGVWHSHPAGPSTPSLRDRDGVTDLSWIWLIATPHGLSAFLPDAGAAGGFRAVPLLDGGVEAA